MPISMHWQALPPSVYWMDHVLPSIPVVSMELDEYAAVHQACHTFALQWISRLTKGTTACASNHCRFLWKVAFQAAISMMLLLFVNTFHEWASRIVSLLCFPVL
jgi:hypothetical protein